MVQASAATATSWDDSPITLSNLQETFTGIDTDGVMALGGGSSMDIDEMMELFTRSDAWTKTQEPAVAVADDSSNESPAHNSDQERAASSDTSKSDEMFVNIETEDIDIPMDESWTLPELAAEEKIDDDLDGWITFDELKMSSDDDGDADFFKEIDWDKLIAEEAQEQGQRN